MQGLFGISPPSDYSQAVQDAVHYSIYDHFIITLFISFILFYLTIATIYEIKIRNRIKNIEDKVHIMSEQVNNMQNSFITYLKKLDQKNTRLGKKI